MLVEYSKFHFVISTIPPSIYYPIYHSKIGKFYFAGSTKNIQRIKNIINNRLTEYISRPIVQLSENDPAPSLLKDLLKSFTIFPSIDDFRYELEFGDFGPYSPDSSKGEMKISISYQHIDPNERVFLVMENINGGMFIPKHAILMLEEDNKLKEIHLEDYPSVDQLKAQLENKKIIIDRNGFYISFRSIFFKLMLIYGEKIVFRKGTYCWNGFKELFEDATEWISIIKRAVGKYWYEKNLPYKEAEAKFAEYFSLLDLTAEDPNYIQRWWSNYEEVSTETGIYYLYKVEHPKRLSDIHKIYNFLCKESSNR